MYGFVIWSFASVLTLIVAMLGGTLLVATGILKRRRLRTWNPRMATAHRSKGRLYPSLQWAHMGEIYSTSPRGLYLLRKQESIPVLLHPTMPAVCEVNYWTNNGKGRIVLGALMIVLSGIFMFGLFH